MKKIIALILTFAMIMSLFVGFSAMAATEENAVFTQDFENTIDPTNVGKGAYPEKHCRWGGGAGSGWVGKTGRSYNGGAQSLMVFPNDKATADKAGQVRATVSLDNTVFAEGKRYKITAMVNLSRMSTMVDTPLTLSKIGLLKEMGTEYYSSKSNAVTVSHDSTNKTWTKIETSEFEYSAVTYPKPISFAIEFGGYRADSNDRDNLYIDYVQIVEVTGGGSEEKQSYFKGKTNVDFEDVSELVQDLDYYKGGSGDVVFGANPNASGINTSSKSLLLKFYNNTARHALIGLFDDSNVGKCYDITLKIYPDQYQTTGATSIRIGLKGNGVNDNNWSTNKYFTVGEAGSGKDLILNQWNEVTVKGAEVIGGAYPTVLLAIDQNLGTVAKYVYIDDIKITEVAPRGPYFEGLASSEAKTLDFEDGIELSKGKDWSAGGGYKGDVTITNETTANSGSYCLKIGGRNSTNAWNYYRAKLLGVFKNANVGDAFKVSAYFKTGGANSENTTINFGAIADENNGNIIGGTKVNVSNDGWTKGEFTYIVRNLTYTDSNKVNQTVKQDELFVDQTSVANTQENVADIIYVDDLTVEPVADANVFACYNGTANSYEIHRMDVKLTVDNTKFAGVKSPLLILAIYDADDNILCAKVIPYEPEKTTYLINNVLTGKFNERAKARLLMWGTSDDGLVHAVSSTEIYNLATGN